MQLLNLREHVIISTYEMDSSRDAFIDDSGFHTILQIDKQSRQVKRDIRSVWWARVQKWILKANFDQKRWLVNFSWDAHEPFKSSN